MLEGTSLGTECVRNGTVQNGTVQNAFDRFYDNVNYMLDQFYPMSSVKLSQRDPPFVTPLIKLMLCKKNQLMHRGRVEAANALAIKIQRAIIARNSSNFCNIDNVKELWEKVRQASGKGKSAPGTNSTITAEMINDHYSNLSTDPNHQAPTIGKAWPLNLKLSSRKWRFSTCLIT